MPKKTKKEKIIAQYHRKLQSLCENRFQEPSISSSPPSKSVPLSSNYVLPNTPKLKVSPKSNFDLSYYPAIMADLKKTIGLSFLAIAVELTLAKIMSFIS